MPTTLDADKTEVGSYFISNYPPYSQWTDEGTAEAVAAMAAPPRADTPLGLYVHIPFCRKRCKFCYFRVYTDKNARDIDGYMTALAKEIEILARQPCVGGRPFRFVYFGGGTPSYLAVKQLQRLQQRLRASISWEDAEEVTFECEPGTLQESKVHAMKEFGVTRLSLGIENFSDDILRENGRAHLSEEVYRCWDWIRAADFPNVNIDLIAGMVGESWSNWRENVRRTIELSPDSVTIYQLELPYNTVYSKDILEKTGAEVAVANWSTKRDWLNYAFDELEATGYSVSSAYTMVKDTSKVNFSYRDNLWAGSDLLATGVASFGHISGVHYQNKPDWPGYMDPLLEEENPRLPLGRAMRPTLRQLLIRQLILQLKRGYLDCDALGEKFGVNMLDAFSDAFARHEDDGWLTIDRDAGRVELTRAGLLRADALLPTFFEPELRDVRYT